MPYLGTFRRWFEIIIVTFDISTFENVKMWSFMLKKKNEIYDQKMPYFGIFGLIFGETIAICEISTFEFVKMQSFMLKGKKIIFGTKNALFGYFWTRIWKSYCHNWNQPFRTSQNAKLQVNLKQKLNLGPKLPYLGVFR